MNDKFFKITFHDEIYYTNKEEDAEFYRSRGDCIIEEIEEWEYDLAKEEEAEYDTNRY